MNAHPPNGHGSATAIDRPAPSTDEAALSVTVCVYQSGPWTVVEVEGEMDIQAVSLVTHLVGSDATCVVFDLHRVTFMDASGLGVMEDIQRRALRAGGGVRLVAPSRSARRLLTLTGCDHAFRVFESLDRAVLTPTSTDPAQLPLRSGLRPSSPTRTP